MSRDTPSVRLVVSMLAAQEAARAEAVRLLTARLGPLVHLSAPLPFDSSYYAPEMGGPLTRRLAAFLELAPPHGLAQVKGVCLELERELALEGRRQVNLDPGVLSAGSLVLASTKQRPHRIALAPDLWAELTLLYQQGAWQPLPWTYPDYAGHEMCSIFTSLRQRYLWQLRQEKAEGGASC